MHPAQPREADSTTPTREGARDPGAERAYVSPARKCIDFEALLFCVLVFLGRRPRAAHGTRGGTRAHPAQRHAAGSSAPTCEGARRPGAERASCEQPPFRPFLDFVPQAARGARRGGGRPACTPPDDASAVPTRPTTRACVAGGRSKRSSSAEGLPSCSELEKGAERNKRVNLNRTNIIGTSSNTCPHRKRVP